MHTCKYGYTHVHTYTHDTNTHLLKETSMYTHVRTPTHPNIMHAYGRIHVNTYVSTHKGALCPFIYLADTFLACLSSVGKKNLLNYPVAQMCLKPTLQRGYHEAI